MAATENLAADSLTSPAAMAAARADSTRRPYTRADIHFMTAMIGHHAQAIEMARMAESHRAGPQVQILAARIVNAQRDEIHTMRTWLADRGQPVPDADGTAPGHAATHGHTMATGMLTETQMRQLDAAQGDAFDVLFLRYMIQHHRGAVEMVDELFGSYGAGQDEVVFKLASDVNVDQTTEIERMQRMLTARLLAADQP